MKFNWNTDILMDVAEQHRMMMDEVRLILDAAMTKMVESGQATVAYTALMGTIDEIVGAEDIDRAMIRASQSHLSD